MKKTSIFLALMMLITVSVSAQKRKYTVTERTNIEDANVNGIFTISNQYPYEGDSVTVTCSPDDKYGMASSLFYAVKNDDGTYSSTKEADEKSAYTEDRANPRLFKFEMPKGNVEVWAYFEPTRVMVVHQAPDGKLIPQYGRRERKPDSLVYNLPYHTIKLIVSPKDKNYELVDVKTVNLHAANIVKTADTVTVTMPKLDPNRMDTIHVTPVFGKKNYKVSVANTKNIKATVTPETPKAYEEVEVVLESDKDFIPTNFSVTGSKSWWLVGKPQQKDDGGWKVTYRVKVDMQDVAIEFNQQQVHSFTVSDTQNSGRVKTLIPEVIPDFPGVATKGQQIPVVFMMPESFSIKYTSSGASSPLVYQNVLENSFADQNMFRWHESNDYRDWGLRMKVDVDTDGNKYWATSVKNSMSQSVLLTGRPFPKSTSDNGKLSVAAIASINSRKARTAEVSIVACGEKVTESKIVIADLKNQGDNWQTVFKTAEVNSKADTLKFVVSSLADDLSKKQSYDGPLFDDLCLLLPVDKESIVNEDVLIFTMGDTDVNINYTPSGQQRVMNVVQQDHATVTLLNKATGEEGESIKVMEKDVIVITGKYDEGYAIFDMECQMKTLEGKNDGDPELLNPDSVNLAASKIYYHYTIFDDSDFSITPVVDQLKVEIQNNYGGEITVNKEYAKKGEKVIVTVKPNAGCKFKRIATFPAENVAFKEEQVDAATGAGTYSFEMTSSFITLTPEFIVPISTAEEFTKISEQDGEFYLTADLDLGNNWNKEIKLNGHFNGNGHRITYSGTKSLFHNVFRHASVRHLYVKANVDGDNSYIGGITRINSGVIEDCEVRGTVKSKGISSAVGGVAGLNLFNNTEGIISRCHVLCDAIEGAKVYGIASLETGGTIKNNVFNGQFVNRDNVAYMICNQMSNSTIEGNYYVTNSGNTRGTVFNGIMEAKPATFVDVLRNTPDDCIVFAASLRGMYDGGYLINLALVPEVVELVNKSSEKAAAGTEFSASVRVIGNNHLESITISASDGSNPQNCPFTDNQDNVYFFSFTMPARDVLVSFKTANGKFIYTPQQFAEISNVPGTFYLARDLDLNDWSKKVDLNGTFKGNGHTIKYHGNSSCVGLFQRIRPGALLQGLRVVGFVETKSNCGGIALESNGTISDCHFTGSIKRVAEVTSKKSKVAPCVSAIVCKADPAESKLDHCSASAELTCSSSQAAINEHPLCFQSDIDISTCTWVDATRTDQYSKYNQLAEAARKTYPVYAQGIFEATTPSIIAGHDTIRVERGKTLDELTLTDGEPFRVTGEVKVKRIVYKRKATKGMEQWIFPFAFNRMTGNGDFKYCMTKIDENRFPEIGQDTTKLVLSSTPQAVEYKANSPWLVTVDGGEYVLTNSNSSITLKSTADNLIDRHVAVMDSYNLYVTNDTIPGKAAQEGLMYVWDVDKQGFFCSDSVDILPNRFYAQYSNVKLKSFVKYTQTAFPKQIKASSRSNRAAPQRLAAAVADGWQPIFLDPREPQSVTAQMLDYYEVAYLTDVYAEADDKSSTSQRSAVSLVYQMVDDRMELPTAIPLLVRAKRSDAVPLVNEQMGDELDALLLLAETMDDEEENTEDYLEMPDYWCGTLSNRLDIWHLPSSESYADLAEFGCMMFDDTRLEQTFNYATATDSRTTAPMSYCITVLNTDTFESLPLIGDRIFVEFIGASSATGIDLTPNTSPIGEGDTPMYNISGQRVGASYKGIILQNGRKYIKR